ncbi:semaphorin-7A isoform X2 [Syngnathus scovelli]|uniref:semaphorin-7A isoform X2 n=1 Tax=Syngnathus scovelli TaxID=161590 RepID=UPI0021108AE5|nr:semaphorin-7A isoform X2 [Syngnathus scovelli]
MLSVEKRFLPCMRVSRWTTDACEMKLIPSLLLHFLPYFPWSLHVSSEDTPIFGSKNIPRLLSQDVIRGNFFHPAYRNQTVLFYHEDSGETYVGGTDFVIQLNLDRYEIAREIPLKATGEEPWQEGPCEYVITVIEKFGDSLFVCGTNGHRPHCWKLGSSATDTIAHREGTGITPFSYTQNALSLTVEGDLYAAAPLDTDGSSLQFRRIAGRRGKVWMYDSWVSDPTFVSASWVKRKDDPENEKIYIFFREKNSDQNPEADPWISRVARVCKTDEGGSKRFFQNTWTSFLKARLVCGFPEESLYFNRLQDVYVQHAPDWRDARVYALFTSSWNATALCIYSMETIEGIFNNSTFKGYDKAVPEPRPGACVRNSRLLPLATVSVVRDYPEMSDWVHTVHHTSPFYVSNDNYTKIVVDRVQAADLSAYNVLLLATDSGKIHKILESGSEPFIISQTEIPSQSSIQSMKLDSKKKKLVVSFAEKISVVDLRSCDEYNKSCEDCVLARDPYCSWTNSGCTPTVPEGIQNIVDGRTSVCSATTSDYNQVNRTRRNAALPVDKDLLILPAVPMGVPFYLSCPIDSYHAVYTWKHGDQSIPCLQMHSICLHLIPAMTPESYGNYDCVSEERDYVKVVKRYHLTEQDGRRTEGQRASSTK